MFKLFEVFGELSMKGAEAAEKVMSGAEAQGKKLASGLNSLGGSAKSAGDGLSKGLTGPIVAATTALGALAFRAMGTGDDLAKFSRSVGIGVEALQEYEFALGRIAGVSEGQTRKALEFMNRTLADGTQGNEKAIETFTKLGFSMDEVTSGAIGTEDAMDAALNAIRNATSEAEAQAIAMSIFGNRQGIALANNIRESAETIQDARRIFREEIGGMSQAQAEMAEAAADAWDQLKRTVTNAVNQIGAESLPLFLELIQMAETGLVPAIVGAAKAVAGAVKWFSELDPWLRKSILAFVAIVAAVGPVLSIVGRLMILLSGAVKVFAVIAKAAALLKVGLAVVGAALAIITAPITLIVAALAALGAALYLNREKVGEWLTGLKGFLEKSFLEFVKWKANIVKLAFELGREVGKAIGDMARRVMKSVSDMVTNALSSLQNLYKRAVGNSIIPDLARDVTRVVGSMASDSIKETQRMEAGMTGAMGRIESSSLEAAGGPLSAGRGGGSVINLQHAVFNTEGSTDHRMPITAHDLTGAF